MSGSRPTEQHEGLTFSIASAANDFVRPRRVQGAFKRSERCPACGWDLHNATRRAEVEAAAAEGAGHGHGDAYFEAREDGSDAARVPLKECTRCGGEGFVEVSATHSHRSRRRPAGGSGGGGGGGGGDDDDGDRDGASVPAHSFAEQTMRVLCPACRGLGTVVARPPARGASESCSVCHDKRFVAIGRGHTAELAAGLPSNWRRTLANEGGETIGRLPGNLLVQLVTELGAPPLAADIGEAGAQFLHSSNVTRVGLLRGFFDSAADGARRRVGPAAAPEPPPLEIPPRTSAADAAAAAAALELLALLPANASWDAAEDPAGPHLLMRLTLSLDEAVRGFRRQVGLLRRGVATLRPAALPVLPGDVFVVPGGGLPVYLPGRCVFDAGAACEPRDEQRGLRDDDPRRAPWASVCDFDSEAAARACPLEPLRAAWEHAFGDWEDACGGGAFAPPPLPGMQALHAALSGGDARPDWRLREGEAPPRRTHVVCAASHDGDSAVRDFPHGAMLVLVDVNVDLLGPSASAATGAAEQAAQADREIGRADSAEARELRAQARALKDEVILAVHRRLEEERWAS